MKYNKQAFTLIELLVVVLIIGILAAIAVPQYQVAVMKSRLASTIPGVTTLAKAAEAYYLANGTYPEDIQELDISEIAGCTLGLSGTHTCKNHIEYHVNCSSNYQFSAVNVSSYIRGSNNELRLFYMQYLEHSSSSMAGKRACYAYDSSALSHKVCKAMGGIVSTYNPLLYVLP